MAIEYARSVGAVSSITVQFLLNHLPTSQRKNRERKKLSGKKREGEKEENVQVERARGAGGQVQEISQVYLLGK